MKSLFFDGKHDHIILTDTGEVLEFSDSRIQEIQKTIEEVFGVEIDIHSLYFYETRNIKVDDGQLFHCRHEAFSFKLGFLAFNDFRCSLMRDGFIRNDKPILFLNSINIYRSYIQLDS